MKVGRGGGVMDKRLIILYPHGPSIAFTPSLIAQQAQRLTDLIRKRGWVMFVCWPDWWGPIHHPHFLPSNIKEPEKQLVLFLPRSQPNQQRQVLRNAPEDERPFVWSGRTLEQKCGMHCIRVVVIWEVLKMLVQSMWHWWDSWHSINAPVSPPLWLLRCHLIPGACMVQRWGVMTYPPPNRTNTNINSQS